MDKSGNHTIGLGQPAHLHHQVGEPPTTMQTNPKIKTASNFPLHLLGKLIQIVIVEGEDLHPDIAQPSFPGSVGQDLQALPVLEAIV